MDLKAAVILDIGLVALCPNDHAEIESLCHLSVSAFWLARSIGLAR